MNKNYPIWKQSIPDLKELIDTRVDVDPFKEEQYSPVQGLIHRHLDRVLRIGIAAENRPEEKRVILRPQELRELSNKHEILVESGAGKGIGINDSEYEKVHAQVVEKDRVYACDIVIRLKEPVEEELKLMKPGAILFSMLHLLGNHNLRDLLKKYKVIGIPMEEIRDPFGARKIEALHETGYLGMKKGFELWEAAGNNRDPSKCVVKVMGYGPVAWGAIRFAARNFSSVTVLNKKDFNEMERFIPGTDILVNGINWPIEERGKTILITREMLKLFKSGSVILDLISNPEGQSPIETLHPTGLNDNSFVIDGVIHTSCWGWPGLDPEGISKRYSIQVAPILLEIADGLLDSLPDYILKVIV